jgi:hypothetical protein
MKNKAKDQQINILILQNWGEKKPFSPSMSIAKFSTKLSN